MDKKIILIALIVVASGCTDIQGNSSSSGDGSVQISQFSINDNTLYPGQEGLATLVIDNYDPEAEIEELQLVNTGALTVEESDWKDRCGSSELPDPVNGQPGVMECTWAVKAPSSSELGSFSSKSYAPQLMMRYNTVHRNSEEPVRIHFKPSKDIKSAKKMTRTISNGEVSTSLSFENPSPLDLETPLNVKIKANSEHVVSDTYGFEISPASMIKTCNGEAPQNGRMETESEIGPNGQAEFQCTLSPERQTTRNVIVSTSYKYQKAPSLNIEVVSR